MDDKLLLFEFLDAEKYRISLSLGECQLDSKPLGRNEAGIVFKARMNGKDVALKFFLFNGDDSRKGKWLNKLKARYLEISLLETRNNIVQYADFDIVTVEGEEIPVLVMKLYKCSLEEYRSILSMDTFLKLFRFLTNTVQF